MPIRKVMSDSIIRQPHWFWRHLPVLLVLAIGGTLYRSPANAAGWDLTPDAVEYAAGAHRFATMGRFDIDVCGVIYPSRYLPWFSTLLLAPAYLLSAQQLGSPIIVIWLFAISALLGLYYFTKQLAGEWTEQLTGQWAGVLAVVVLSRIEIFEMMSRLMMTDVPALALGLWAGVLTVRLIGSPHLSNRKRAVIFALLSVIGALAGAIRPLYFAVLIPIGIHLLMQVIQHRKAFQPILEIMTLVIPSCAVLILNALYQYTVFGSISRSGYNFWCPIPYDVPGGTFSIRYLTDNLLSLTPVAGLLGLGLIGAILLKRQNPESKPARRFILGSGCLISFIHLFYFYPDGRLHLLLIAFCISLGIAGVVRVIPNHSVAMRYCILPIVLIALIWPRDPVLPVRLDRPDISACAAVINQSLPDNAIVITGADLVVYERHIIHGTQRKLIPINRGMEYASKVVAFNRVQLSEHTIQYIDHPRAMLGNGLLDAVSYSVIDDPAQLGKLLQNSSVYIDASRIPTTDPTRLRIEKLYRVEWNPAHPWLGQLHDMPVASSVDVQEN